MPTPVALPNVLLLHVDVVGMTAWTLGNKVFVEEVGRCDYADAAYEQAQAEDWTHACTSRISPSSIARR